MRAHKIITSKNRYKDKVQLISLFFIAMENRPRYQLLDGFVSIWRSIRCVDENTNEYYAYDEYMRAGNTVGRSSGCSSMLYSLLCV